MIRLDSFPLMLRQAVVDAGVEDDPVKVANVCHDVWADLLIKCDWHPWWSEDVVADYGIDPDDAIYDWREYGTPDYWSWRGREAWIRPNGRVLTIRRNRTDVNMYDPAELAEYMGMVTAWEWHRAPRPFRGSVSREHYRAIAIAFGVLLNMGCADDDMAPILLDEVRDLLPKEDTASAFMDAVAAIRDTNNIFFDLDATLVTSGERVFWCWDSTRIIWVGDGWVAAP